MLAFLVEQGFIPLYALVIPPDPGAHPVFEVYPVWQRAMLVNMLFLTPCHSPIFLSSERGL
jgi:hypothetical protein